VIVRPIQALEISEFSERAAGPDRGFAPEEPAAFMDWLDARWMDGSSAPALCLVAETDETTLASLVLWREADLAHVEHLRGNEDACTELLRSAVPLLRDLGVRRVWAEAVTPPTPEERADAVGRICAAADFTALAPGVRVRFDMPPAADPPATDLVFRHFDDTGRGAFIDAMARCTPGTLEPEIARDLAELGPRGDATQRIDRLLALDGDHSGWRLAYSRDGDLAGMVLPSRAGGPVIAFVGVVPHWRGRGVARQLLRHATTTLAAAGAEQVGGDTSSTNQPMVRAFAAAGFRPFATRRVWERTI